MTPDEREQIVDATKYLRNVRPIDPDEVSEYVEGRPHPGVVRQAIRESAFELGLIEREDGTFVPVRDEPATPAFEGVSAFPERYGRVLESALVDHFGPGWPEGDSGDRLRGVIRRLKEDYYQQHPVEYDETVALGYAVYHLPDYYAAIQYVLDDLGSAGRLPRTLRVLDVGAGVGGPALGLVEYLPDDALLGYEAIEPGAGVALLRDLLAETGPNVHWSITDERAEDVDPEGPFDLLLFANVLSELDEPVAVVRRYADLLADAGSLVLLAPADKHTSTQLRSVERALADDLDGPELGVYSPDLRLWPDASPTDQGWSFDVRQDLAVPAFQQAIDPGDGEFVNVDVQYSHAILRSDGERRFDVRASPERHARFADAEEHVSKRVDCLAVKLSHDLATEPDANPLFKVGDGSEQVGVYAVLTRETGLNRPLQRAAYGDVCQFQHVLVLWNDDEGAYNLVVDDETLVDTLTG